MTEVLERKYKGRYTCIIDADGRIRVRTGYTRSGWEYEHRLIMEEFLGRRLRTNEAVHHKNEDVADNRLENLALMSVSHHVGLHNHLQPKRKKKSTIDSAIETLPHKAE
jgi:hypothetical protein